MEPIRSIAEIPFLERDPIDLLGLADLRDDIDHGYYDYGYSRVELVCLHSAGSPDPLIVRDALILALHSADDGEEFADDVELEFFIDEVADDYSVTVLLSVFLAKRLPEILAQERAIVLVLCNPYRAILPRPGFVGHTPVYYAMGDVAASLDHTEGRRLIDLMADDWRTAE